MDNKTFKIVGLKLFHVNGRTNDFKMVKEKLFVKMLYLSSGTFEFGSEGFIISFRKLINGLRE